MTMRTAKTLCISTMLASLAACGGLDRLASVGKAPELTPIKDVPAPPRERSISVPLPANNETPNYRSNSLWRVGAKSFFKDQRASRIGDLLTVNIDVNEQAEIENETERTRTTAENANVQNFFGAEQSIANLLNGGELPAQVGPVIGADSTASYVGEGSVGRSESINLTVAVIVTDILPNGNMVIQGRQEIRVNFEKRELLIAGIIRPEDITSTNTIQHTQIAEARISYGGKGQITDVQQPRYGTQVYDIIFPF